MLDSAAPVLLGSIGWCCVCAAACVCDFELRCWDGACYLLFLLFCFVPFAFVRAPQRRDKDFVRRRQNHLGTMESFVADAVKIATAEDSDKKFCKMVSRNSIKKQHKEIATAYPSPSPYPYPYPPSYHQKSSKPPKVSQGSALAFQQDLLLHLHWYG